MRALIVEGRSGGGFREHLQSAIHLGWTGAEVGFALPGEDLITHVRTWRPQVALVDISSGMSERLPVLRSLRELSDAVIVAVSESYREYDLLEAVEAGADDYMPVPLNLPLFVARVRAALRRVQRDAPEEPVIFGELQINSARHQATIEGCELSLTSTEFRLLLELGRRNDSVVQKAPLCRTLWGNSGGPEDAILRKHIQNLRKKLSAAPSSPVNIVTVPGVGYRLAVANSEQALAAGP